MNIPLEQQEKIKNRWLKFLEKRREKILKINIDKNNYHTLTLNPFLLRALKMLYNFDSAKSIITYLVESTLMAGNETAYGFAIEDTLISFKGVIKDQDHGREVDIKVERENRTHLYQVKAGPNTINKTMAVAISSDLKKIGEETGHITGLAMTYGKADRISGIIQNSPFESLQIGKELWSFLGEDPNTHSEIFEIIGDAEIEFNNKYGDTLGELKNKLIEKLTEDFIRIYGDEDALNSLIKISF